MAKLTFLFLKLLFAPLKLLGCKFDNNADGNVPQCPAAESVCNAETHFCQAQSGSTLLTKMVFNSNGCDGCTTEGVNMTLTGSIFVATPPECKTVNLDHPGTPDYVSKGTFLATHDEQNNGWASCYRVSSTNYDMHVHSSCSLYLNL